MHYVILLHTRDMRTCTQCHLGQPDDHFYVVHRHGIPQALSRCKSCTTAYQRERNKLPQVKAATAANYRRKRAAGWCATPWSEITPGQKRGRYAAVARYRQSHPEMREVYGLSRRLLRTPQFLVAWPAIVAHYGGHCLLCKRNAVTDHVLPLSPGCSTDLNQLVNLQPLCRGCNTIKGQMPDSSTDYRPDKGAWIADLVRLNPTLYIDHNVQRGGRHKDVPGTLMLPTDTICHP